MSIKVISELIVDVDLTTFTSNVGENVGICKKKVYTRQQSIIPFKIW